MQSRYRRHHPLKWPAAITAALVCLFAGIFLVPSHWLDLFFPPAETRAITRQKMPVGWLQILPPLEMESIREMTAPSKKPDPPKKNTPSVDDPRWWTAAWQVKTTSESTFLQAPSSRDSVSLLLETLGVGMDFSRKALPDSLLNHRLMLLRIEEGFSFEELKPYLSALGKARAMADKKSREAAMYDEHLGSQIMVPD